MDDRPGFWARAWLALSLFFRLLGDAPLAARVRRVTAGGSGAEPGTGEPAALPPGPATAADLQGSRRGAPIVAVPATQPDPVGPADSSALVLLSLLQREGRLLDFLSEDLDAIGDERVGAVARVVHAGCRKALRGHVRVEPLEPKAEGERVEIPAGFSAARVHLLGTVSGAGPYRGVVRHRGWRGAVERLPRPIEPSDAEVLAPAEVEL